MINLSPAAQSLWAKSTEDEQGHALIGHLLDVAACAEALLEREPTSTRRLYAQDFQAEEGKALHWVIALVGLHDLGKASPAFQHKWLPGAQRVWNHGLTWDGTPPNVRHGVVTHELLTLFLENQGWRFRIANQIGDAVGAHHGFRSRDIDLPVSVYALGHDHIESLWSNVQRELFETVLAIKGIKGDAPHIQSFTGEAYMRLAGLTSFVDWIGSNEDFFSYGRDTSNLEAYYCDSVNRAHRALDTIGWTPREPLTTQLVTFSDIFAPYAPRPLQQAMIDLVAEQREPCLLIVEAPMGEGKTEAAFYAHTRLQTQVGHRGMYVALPTQATGNAMFERVRDFLQAFKRDIPVDLQLLHGAALLSDSYTNLRIRAVDGDERAVVAREWFSAKKRALLTEYGVGTVDQALLSILNIKHQFVRLWGLANRVVVIDEVHAYDMYTGKLIETLVRWLHALGSSVILMSATLPKQKRHDLLEAFGATDDTSVPYPRITKVDSSGADTLTFTTRQQAPIFLEAADLELNSLADIALNTTAQEGCAACIVNTVARAQELYLLLQTKAEPDVQLFLFHARYPAEDRKTREEQVLALFGKHASHRPKRAILVATQVVEQSLDVDFDVMITDIAPIDLVLQRAGRMHRHERPERPIKEPRLYVAGLASTDVPNFDVHSVIYDPYTLLKTWWTLKQRDKIYLPDDFDPLINAVYSGDLTNDIPEALQQALEQARETLNKLQQQDLNVAADAVIGKPEGFMRQSARKNDTKKDIDEDDAQVHSTLRPVTRLGDSSVVVIPLFQQGNHVTLDPEGKKVIVGLSETLSCKQAKALYMRSLRLSNRKGRYRDIIDQGVPTGWQKQPLLRQCYPLIVDGEGKIALERVSITVSDELGIVIDYNKK